MTPPPKKDTADGYGRTHTNKNTEGQKEQKPEQFGNLHGRKW